MIKLTVHARKNRHACVEFCHYPEPEISDLKDDAAILESTLFRTLSIECYMLLVDAFNKRMIQGRIDSALKQANGHAIMAIHEPDGDVVLVRRQTESGKSLDPHEMLEDPEDLEVPFEGDMVEGLEEEGEES